ncbi:MAG: hypothetical protein JNL08_08460 [Planctomycetes bacterium]|nr:hypothetical protein [Planctomycetota bacterium]
MTGPALLRVALCLLSIPAAARGQLDWVSVSTTGSPGWGAASAWDETRGRLVSFGGTTPVPISDVTAEWNGTAWVVASPAAAPSPRAFAAMAFDAARGNCVLFGGAIHPVNSSGETWVWNGTAWTQRFPGVSPSPRKHVAMAYDGARQVVVLFGGLETPAFVASSETWEWDGTSWTLRVGLGATPPGRHSASMAYDEGRGRIVLCGGSSFGPQNSRNDTWEWDGSTWTQMANLPDPTSDHTLVYDRARRRVVLVGGVTVVADFAVAALDQVLDWDGISWTQRSTTADFALRTKCVSGYDTTNHRLLVAGGAMTPALLDVTAALAPVAAAEFASFGAGCPTSAGPLSLASSSLPYLGIDFVQAITNAPASATTGFVVFGSSNTILGGSPLPIALGAFGAPGCELLVSDDGFLHVPLQNGAGTHAWTVPVQAGLVGQRFFAQAFVVDPLLPWALPIGASSGRAGLIGSP